MDAYFDDGTAQGEDIARHLILPVIVVVVVIDEEGFETLYQDELGCHPIGVTREGGFCGYVFSGKLAEHTGAV